jgi:hypothetical protein
MATTFAQWFAQECFSVVRKYDCCCQRRERAFCEINELPQNAVLHSHFSTLDNVRICEMGSPYPQGRRSDLFIETIAGQRLFSEIKGMYKTWYIRNRRPYPAYLWAPFQNASRPDSAGFDLAKLATLSGSDTTHIALIVIGSSLPQDHMDEDLDKFAQMANVDSVPWESYRDYWANQWHGGYYYDLRVWACERKKIPEWWVSVADVYQPHGYRFDLAD